MSKFVKLSQNKVLFKNSIETAVFSTAMNVLPHPKYDQFIMISDDCNLQEYEKGFLIDWKQVEGSSNLSRSEFIEFLGMIYFNPYFRRDVSRDLDTVGDGTGTVEFNLDYSETGLGLTKAIYKPLDDNIVVISNLRLFLADRGSLDAESYGNGIIIPDGQGILLRHEKVTGELIKDYTVTGEILRNVDWDRIGLSLNLNVFGVGLEFLIGNSCLGSGSTPQTLNPDEQIAIYLRSDFSGLENHRFSMGAYTLE